MRKLGLATLIFGACLAQAGEKGLMHCFAFSPIKEATQADWDAFYKATDAMPKNMPFVKHVFFGKLARPLNQYSSPDADAAKKARGGEKGVTAELRGFVREYGACMHFDGGPEVLKQYTAHPYHKVWSAAYEKVRVAGTTTFDIIGQ
jgi:hypothetical protein